MFFARVKRLARTVGVRLALWHSAIFGAGAITAFALAYVSVRHAVDEQTDDAIQFRAQQFVAEHARGGVAAVIEVCKLRRGRAQKAFFVRVANAKNQTIFLRDPEDWAEFRPEALALAPIPEEPVWAELGGVDGAVLRIASRPLGDGGLLQVGRTLENREELLGRFRNVLIGITALVLALGVPAGAFIALRALRPVRELTATVHSILGTGKFTARVPWRGTGDEIDELVNCFNTMLVKIDALLRGMRESLDNVAHDLRTPVTRLRNVVMSALNSDADKAACQEALAECLEESERITTMLGTLMDIAEAESGVVRLERRPMRVAALAGQVVDLYGHVAEEHEIALSVQVPADLEIECDPVRFYRALANLLDNAIKYTPSGGEVHFRAWRADGSIHIEIADTGEGIPAEEQTRIWDRLYRVDKSRSQRGLGLGLSFVRAIVEAHGGEVAVQSAPGEGSRFSVRLPAPS
jgi:signal transduction histidine kinase